MSEALDQAIKVLLELITENITPDQALKFTQAALNLAHVRLSYVTVAQNK